MKQLTHYFARTVIIFFISCQTYASDLIIMKYAYGRRGLVDSKYEPATTYPLYDYNYFYSYSYSDTENLKIKKINHVSLDLKIRVKKNDLLGVVTLKNNGKESLFLSPTSFTSMSRQFFITTDNVVLDYLGYTVDYGQDFWEDDYLEVKPGGTISLTQVLNNNHEFFLGEKEYSIGSKEYMLVNEKWFVNGNIQSAFESITTPDENTCYKEESIPYVFDALTLCDWRYRHHPETLINVLSRFGYDDDNNKNSFEVRTDPIMVKINGSKLTSLYDKEPFSKKKVNAIYQFPPH